MAIVIDLARYQALPDAARELGISPERLRYHARLQPGMAVKSFGRVYIDRQVLTKLAAPRPVTKQAG